MAWQWNFSHGAKLLQVSKVQITFRTVQSLDQYFYTFLDYSLGELGLAHELSLCMLYQTYHHRTLVSDWHFITEMYMYIIMSPLAWLLTNWSHELLTNCHPAGSPSPRFYLMFPQGTPISHSEPCCSLAEKCSSLCVIWPETCGHLTVGCGYPQIIWAYSPSVSQFKPLSNPWPWFATFKTWVCTGDHWKPSIYNAPLGSYRQRFMREVVFFP